MIGGQGENFSRLAVKRASVPHRDAMISFSGACFLHNEEGTKAEQNILGRAPAQILSKQNLFGNDNLPHLGQIIYRSFPHFMA